jgi:hypothetical protein
MTAHEETNESKDTQKDDWHASRIICLHPVPSQPVQADGIMANNNIMKATDWQAHSVRGFISGTLGKKMGLKIESTKREDGERVYSLAK